MGSESVAEPLRKGRPKEGDRPVRETVNDPRMSLSTTGHVLSGGKLGGPSSNPKYSYTTDSEQVP